MWPFKRKKQQRDTGTSAPCPHCGSSETRVTTADTGGEEGSPIKTWRGERYVTWRCLSCGQEFYTGEPPEGSDALPLDDRIIEDEQALRDAEEDLKRRTDEENDRRYMPGG